MLISTSINFEFLSTTKYFTVLSNSQLVLNILSVNTPVNLMATTEIKPINCLSNLTTIPEAISNDPSCSNLHDLSKEVDQQKSWRIYENDESNSKSTDALIEHDDEDESRIKYSPSNISFTIVKENPFKSNSNNSLQRAAMEASEKSMIVTGRSRSGSKTISRIYEPMSSESLTDSHGYMDDFDESCALITAENDRRKRMSSSNDLIPKRNSLGVNKVPQSHRFSAGDADKLEKGIKTSMPSTRSLRDS